jgi:hypothetical protein
MFILLFITPYTAFVGQVPRAFYNPPVLSLLALLFAGFPPYWPIPRWGFSEDLASGANYGRH